MYRKGMFTFTGFNGGCCNGNSDERGEGEDLELHYGGDVGGYRFLWFLEELTVDRRRN